MRQGSFAIEQGVSGDQQESMFMNSTLSTHGDALMVSIAITPRFPAGLDTNDEDAVEAYLRRAFAPLQAEGFDIEIKSGIDVEGGQAAGANNKDIAE